MLLGIIIALGITWLWLYYEWRRSPRYEDIWGDDLFSFEDDDDDYKLSKRKDEEEDDTTADKS
jgi:hypothetical protein